MSPPVFTTLGAQCEQGRRGDGNSACRPVAAPATARPLHAHMLQLLGTAVTQITG